MARLNYSLGRQVTRYASSTCRGSPTHDVVGESGPQKLREIPRPSSHGLKCPPLSTFRHTRAGLSNREHLQASQVKGDWPRSRRLVMRATPQEGHAPVSEHVLLRRSRGADVGGQGRGGGGGVRATPTGGDAKGPLSSCRHMLPDPAGSAQCLPNQPPSGRWSARPPAQRPPPSIPLSVHARAGRQAGAGARHASPYGRRASSTPPWRHTTSGGEGGGAETSEP